MPRWVAGSRCARSGLVVSCMGGLRNPRRDRSMCYIKRRVHNGVLVILVWCGAAACGAQTAAPGSAVVPGPAVNSFYADRRAHQIGDVLTVLITESATVSASARTQTNKSSSASAGLSTSLNNRRAVGADLSNDFSGGGQIERSGRLLARLAVSVQSQDAQGNLRIAGEQNIVINNERQLIRLTGLVRAEDIGPDNTVSSNRISEAHIELSGRGSLAKRQSPGWLSRLFGWIVQ